MKQRLFTGLLLATMISLSACNDAQERKDGTDGKAVNDIDAAVDEGAVKADATVIDNDAGPTVTPSAADSARMMNADSMGARP